MTRNHCRRFQMIPAGSRQAEANLAGNHRFLLAP